MKIGAKVVSHGPYVMFQMVEVAAPHESELTADQVGDYCTAVLIGCDDVKINAQTGFLTGDYH